MEVQIFHKYNLIFNAFAIIQVFFFVKKNHFQTKTDCHHTSVKSDGGLRRYLTNLALSIQLE